MRTSFKQKITKLKSVQPFESYDATDPNLQHTSLCVSGSSSSLSASHAIRMNEDWQLAS